MIFGHGHCLFQEVNNFMKAELEETELQGANVQGQLYMQHVKPRESHCAYYPSNTFQTTLNEMCSVNYLQRTFLPY